MSFQYLNFFQHRSAICLKYIDHTGKVGYRTVKNYTPPVFIPAVNGSSIDAHSIFGVPLTRLSKKESIYETKNLIKEIEGDNFKAFGFSKVDFSYVYDTFKEQQPDNSKVMIHLYDIETTVDHGKPDPIAAKEEINMITVHCSKRKKFFCFYSHSESIDLPEFKGKAVLYHCENEEELLRRYLDWHAADYPDILAGWFSEGFDLPYIRNRMLKILGEDSVNKLSPFGVVKIKEGFDAFGQYMNVDIKGISCLDYKKLYEKFIKEPRESYSLDYIAKVEIKEEKLKHESGIPGHLLYKTNFEDALRYNIQDVALLVNLEGKKQILELAITMAYLSFCNFQDVLSNMRIIDMMFYMYLKDRGIYFEWNYNAPARSPFEGAAVKDVIPGKYKWIATFDVTSEYPSLIMAMNISPETIYKKKVLPITVKEILAKKAARDFALENGMSLAANGAMFSRNKEGFMSAVVRELFALRQKYKKLKVEAEKIHDEDLTKLNDMKNLAYKLILNSIYGVTGNPYFRFFDLLIAEGITLSGQALIGWVTQDVNRALSKLTGIERDRAVSSDTDAAYFDLTDVVEMKFGKEYDDEEALKWVVWFSDTKINKLIEESISRFAEYLNVRDPSVLDMKRENIADSSIFMAKKRYVMSVRNNEGAEYKRGEKLKKTGHEIVKSITPQYVKDAMAKSFDALLFGTPQDYYNSVNEFRTSFMKAEPDTVAKTSSVNGIQEYLERDGTIRKGCPKHSRAAINFNKYIEKLGLVNEYPAIKEGDKIRFIGLKEPNPIKSYTIGWIGSMPKPLEALRPYFDYEDQFEAIFHKSMQSAATPCGIPPETDTCENPFL